MNKPKKPHYRAVISDGYVKWYHGYILMQKVRIDQYARKVA